MPVENKQSLILYDVTRLVQRRRAQIPTGIDRIDLQWAKAVFEAFGDDCRPVLFLGKQAQVLEKEWPIIVQLIDSLFCCWFGDSKPDEDVARELDWSGLTANAGYGSRMIERRLLAAKPFSARLSAKVRQELIAARHRLRVKRAARRRKTLSDGGPLVYVNASHQGVLRCSGALRELAAGRPVAIAAYIHDLIPIEFPEYTRADQVASLEAFFAELRRFPACFAVNSQATGRSLQRYVNQSGNYGKAPRVEVIYPGFTTRNRKRDLRRSAAANDDAPPDFVILGTIEPRKNHLVLLHIWRQLAEEGFEPMPRLTIIGRRGWDVGGIAALLDRSPTLRPYVRELSGLSDGQLFEHLQSATALLFPSFAEGFGLPLMEAAELGVPIIAADLDVFRELVTDGVTFLSPLDALAWKAAIVEATTRAETPTSPGLNPELRDWLVQRQRFAAFVRQCATEDGL